MSPSRAAWILPRSGVSTLHELGPQGYRDAPRSADRRVVSMPLLAPHVLDVEADVLVHAAPGGLAIVRGLLRGEPAVERVRLPRSLEVCALAMADGVVYLGGRGAGETLGLVDLAGESRFLAIPADGEGIGGLVADGGRLIVVPGGAGRLRVLDLADPRAPRPVEVHALVPLGAGEETVAVAASHRALALLSTSTNGGLRLFHVRVLDLATLAQKAVLTEQRPSWRRRHDAQAYDATGLALADDHLLLAAGARGVGVLDVARWVTGAVRRGFVDHDHQPRDPLLIPSGALRFVEVGAGKVVGVVPANPGHVFGIVAVKRGALDAVLVPIG